MSSSHPCIHTPTCKPLPSGSFSSLLSSYRCLAFYFQNSISSLDLFLSSSLISSSSPSPSMHTLSSSSCPILRHVSFSAPTWVLRWSVSACNTEMLFVDASIIAVEPRHEIADCPARQCIFRAKATSEAGFLTHSGR